MMILAALGIVIKRLMIIGYGDLPSLPVLPYDQAGAHLVFELVPQPEHVDAVGCALALHTDAPMAGSAAKLWLGVAVVFSRRCDNMRHLMQEVAVIVADAVVAYKIVRRKNASRTVQYKFAGTCFISRMLFVRKSC